jgi:hypothetical protein
MTKYLSYSVQVLITMMKHFSSTGQLYKKERLAMSWKTQVKKSLYETDYLLWLETILDRLAVGDLNQIDLEHLIEEIQALGKSEQHAIASYLMRLCEPLLKVQYWESERETCLRGWEVEIVNFRIQIQRKLKSSPSLNNYLQDNFLTEYGNGRKLFLKASGIEPNLIPESPDFTLEEALDEEWLPSHV